MSMADTPFGEAGQRPVGAPPRPKTFVGFGFGAIQTGLFLWEAQRSRNFERLVVAVPNPEVVAAVRRANGRFKLNIATPAGREVGEVTGLEILDPAVDRDRAALIEAIADADELATALPSVATYDQPETGIAPLLAAGLRQKLRRAQPKPCVLYAGENHNHAAEMLLAALSRHLGPEEQAGLPALYQGLDTVIGKMSRMVREQAEIQAAGLEPFVPQGSRAYLVESFNRILVSRVTLPDFVRGLPVFREKDDLLPFEEAKLYGHNAAHALLGFLARERGFKYIADAAQDGRLMALVREAFLEESGQALIARRQGVDPLFTAAGYAEFADDLLARMVNPWLRDDVERVTRDPRRKLGWEDRLIGTMRMALREGITPHRFARGAAAALRGLHAEVPDQSPAALLSEVWRGAKVAEPEKKLLRALVLDAGAG